MDVAELSPLPVRDLDFEFPDDLPVAWHPTIPELSFAANSISLLMPYVEPYFVRSVRAALSSLVQRLLTNHLLHRRLSLVLLFAPFFIFSPFLARAWR